MFLYSFKVLISVNLRRLILRRFHTLFWTVSSVMGSVFLVSHAFGGIAFWGSCFLGELLSEEIAFWRNCFLGELLYVGIAFGGNCFLRGNCFLVGSCLMNSARHSMIVSTCNFRAGSSSIVLWDSQDSSTQDSRSGLQHGYITHCICYL